jgi:hypothetical protein
VRRTTSITVDAGLWERARALAGMLGVPLSQLVELALRHLLGELPLLAAVLAALERLCGQRPEAQRPARDRASQPPAAPPPEAPAIPPDAPPALRGNVWVALLRKKGGGLQSS